MKQEIKFFISVVAEIFLIIILLLIFLIGVAGLVLPIIPGLALIALGLAVYSFLLKNKNARIIPPFHDRVLVIKNYFLNNKKYMGLIKKIQQARKKKIRDMIMGYGLALFAINLALSMGLFFIMSAMTIVFSFLKMDLISYLFFAIALIFLFAGTCSVAWYRFGQILGSVFKEKKVLMSASVVVASVIPLLLGLFYVSLMISSGFWLSYFLVNIFIITSFVAFLAIVFEIFIVILGVVSLK